MLMGLFSTVQAYTEVTRKINLCFVLSREAHVGRGLVNPSVVYPRSPCRTTLRRPSRVLRLAARVFKRPLMKNPRADVAPDVRPAITLRRFSIAVISCNR